MNIFPFSVKPQLKNIKQRSQSCLELKKNHTQHTAPKQQENTMNLRRTVKKKKKSQIKGKKSTKTSQKNLTFIWISREIIQSGSLHSLKIQAPNPFKRKHLSVSLSFNLYLSLQKATNFKQNSSFHSRMRSTKHSQQNKNKNKKVIFFSPSILRSFTFNPLPAPTQTNALTPTFLLP